MKMKKTVSNDPTCAIREVKQLLKPWEYASLKTSIEDLDADMFEFLTGFNASNPRYIRDETYIHLVMLKAIKELDRIFSRYRDWRSMNFSVRTYLMVYACEISVAGVSRMNFLLSLHPEDLEHVVDMLRFYIETKRIESGVPREEYKVR